MRPVRGAAPTYHYIGAEPRAFDGWESLGDMGWMDADGYVYLERPPHRHDPVGWREHLPRRKSRPRSTSTRTSSRRSSLGIPDEDLGQPCARDRATGGEITVDDLLAHLKERLVRYKIPRSFEFVDEPLRDDVGKARRPPCATSRSRGCAVPDFETIDVLAAGGRGACDAPPT